MDQTALNFRNLLEDEINKKVNYDQDLIERERATQARLSAMPAELRAEFNSSAIRDPFAQERIIAQRRGTAESELGFLNSLRERRGSRYSDILGKSSDTFNAILSDRARAGSGGSGGGGGSDMASLIQSILGGQGGSGSQMGVSNVDDLEIEVDPKANPRAFLQNRYGRDGLFANLVKKAITGNRTDRLDAVGRIGLQPEAQLVTGGISGIAGLQSRGASKLSNLFKRR